MSDKYKFLHFAVSFDKNIAEGEYNFFNFLLVDEAAKMLAEKIAKDGYKNVALFYHNNPADIGMKKYIVENLDRFGIAHNEYKFNSGDKDFRMVISEAESKNPDIYIVNGYAPMIDILTSQIKERGIEKKITSLEAFNLTSRKELYDGFWYVGSGANREFEANFDGMSTFIVGYVYDSIKLITDAYEKSNGSVDEVIDNLHKVEDYDGVVGKLFIDKEGIVHSKPHLKIIKNNRAIYYGEK